MRASLGMGATATIEAHGTDAEEAVEAMAKLLEEQARVFVRSTDKNRVDAASGTVFVSPIFVWYRADFGGSDAALGRYLARYWPDGPEQDLLRSGKLRVRETAYDWSLNGVGAERPKR
jgi:hypothetical protein